MATLTSTRSSNLGLAPNSYIYKIITTSPRTDPYSYSQTDSLAIISSDDSLRIFDPTTLNILPDGVIKSANKSVTCLERGEDAAGNIIVTAGRDGLVNYWDKRSMKKAASIESPNKLISSIVCNSSRNFLATGTENPDDGPSVSPVYVWDTRNPSTPLLSFTESHTDTITSLRLHPDLPTLLLSSSTDGLISIFDTSKPDEDDALYQVINHGSAVAHAGFMFPGSDVYALGTDETLSFFALQSQAEDEEEPAPKVFGDMREQLDAEYLAKMHWIGDEAFIAAGKHSAGSLSLIPVGKKGEVPLDYEVDVGRRVIFGGAHGEEVVRDVFTDVHSETTFTCGEDGFVRAWKFVEGGHMEVEMEGETGKIEERESGGSKKEKRKEKKGKKEKGERYKPY